MCVCVGYVCVVPTLAENGLQVSVDVRRCREPFLTELLLSDNLPHTSSNISCSEWRGIAWCGCGCGCSVCVCVCGGGWPVLCVCVECGVCGCGCVCGVWCVWVWSVVCVCGVWCVCTLETVHYLTLDETRLSSVCTTLTLTKALVSYTCSISLDNSESLGLLASEP